MQEQLICTVCVEEKLNRPNLEQFIIIIIITVSLYIRAVCLLWLGKSPGLFPFNNLGMTCNIWDSHAIITLFNYDDESILFWLDV